MTLCGYQYSLQHRPGELLGNADALSRLPVSISGTRPASPERSTRGICHHDQAVEQGPTIIESVTYGVIWMVSFTTY